MRLIDADDLKLRLPTFSEVIDDTPTIEAEPVQQVRMRYNGVCHPKRTAEHEQRPPREKKG
ncbi:MAG: hypothetical protein IJ060_02640 [Oscillospiraceae bacterium]|nr:hypothetical protein [Oscillospiraceae bacterium]